MNQTRSKIIDPRFKLSHKYLSGDGVEIGALHNPLRLGPAARVRYVDRYDVDGLRRHYPELNNLDLVTVDVIDDGETLSTFREGELDFIVANHFLEHTENPIGTLRNHLSKLRSGGKLFMAVPNKHYCFDLHRPLTSFEHLLSDDQGDPADSRADHYREWTRLVVKPENPADIEARANQLMAQKYSIHFHVWDARTFHDFLERTRAYLGNAFDIEHFSFSGIEILAVLKKRDATTPTGSSGPLRSPGWLSRSLTATWADWRMVPKGVFDTLPRPLRHAVKKAMRRPTT